MANVQFGGLITGLDTNALIAGLVKAEHRSIDVLAAQKVRFQAQDAVITSVIGGLAKVRSAAQSLALSTDFQRKTASSSDASVLSVSASSAASAGNIDIVVDSLASAQTVQSTSFTASTAAIGTGTLTITASGKTSSIVIDGTNNTLSALRDAINDADGDVTATIVNVGAATADYRLILRSKNTGIANAVTIAGTLTGGADPFAGGGDIVQAASDAVFSVNGLTVRRSSNKVSDVVAGLTFSLVGEGDRDGIVETTDRAAQITVTADASSVISSVKNLVESFNAVNDIVNDQFTLDPNTNRQGSTSGDASLRGVIARLRAELSRPGGFGVGYKYLSDVGISFQKDGSLSLDEAKLSEALVDDPAAAGRLFLATEGGIGKRIPDAVDDFISQVDGALTFRQKGIAQSLKRIDEKVVREEDRIAAMQDRLTRQFSALEQIVSQLKSQGDFLAQQLSGLSRR
jgi:flagellar hook-associated protein 2